MEEGEKQRLFQNEVSSSELVEIVEDNVFFESKGSKDYLQCFSLFALLVSPYALSVIILGLASAFGYPSVKRIMSDGVTGQQLGLATFMGVYDFLTLPVAIFVLWMMYRKCPKKNEQEKKLREVVLIALILAFVSSMILNLSEVVQNGELCTHSVTLIANQTSTSAYCTMTAVAATGVLNSLTSFCFALSLYIMHVVSLGRWAVWGCHFIASNNLAWLIVDCVTNFTDVAFQAPTMLLRLYVVRFTWIYTWRQREEKLHLSILPSFLHSDNQSDENHSMAHPFEQRVALMIGLVAGALVSSCCVYIAVFFDPGTQLHDITFLCIHVVSAGVAIFSFFVTHGKTEPHQQKTTSSFSLFATAGALIGIIIAAKSVQPICVLSILGGVGASIGVFAHTLFVNAAHTRIRELSSPFPNALLAFVAFMGVVSMAWVVVAFTSSMFSISASAVPRFPGLMGLGRSLVIMFNFGVIDCCLSIIVTPNYIFYKAQN